VFRLARRKEMLRNSLKLLSAACAGAAMIAATPAAAHSAIAYFSNGGLMTGWVEIANDGHICQSWGTVPGSNAAYFNDIPGDCV
jgi:hypothetical protein